MPDTRRVITICHSHSDETASVPGCVGCERELKLKIADEIIAAAREGDTVRLIDAIDSVLQEWPK